MTSPMPLVSRAKGDNVYKVTVQAAGGADTAIGTHKVEVKVTDKDEDGSVSFDKPQPQIERGLVATFSDDDTPLSDVSWQWSRGPSADGPWTNVGSAAATGSRNPVADDEDSYLLATVTYTDRHGSDKTASKETDNAVEARTVANVLRTSAQSTRLRLMRAWKALSVIR